MTFEPVYKTLTESTARSDTNQVKAHRTAFLLEQKSRSTFLSFIPPTNFIQITLKLDVNVKRGETIIFTL